MFHGLPVRSDTIADSWMPYGIWKIDDHDSAWVRLFSSRPRSSLPKVFHGSVLVLALSFVPSEIERARVYETWNVALLYRLLNEDCSASYHDVVVPSMSVTVRTADTGAGVSRAGQWPADSRRAGLQMALLLMDPIDFERGVGEQPCRESEGHVVDRG